MALAFISDTHLGKTLKTNTTHDSRERLKRKLFDTAKSSIQQAKQMGHSVHHAADLFDKSMNSEDVIRQGATIMHNLDSIMSGNHDVRNIAEHVSSLGLIAVLTGKECPAPLWGPARAIEVYHTSKGIEEENQLAIYAIPHCVSQEVFDRCLVLSEPRSRNFKSILMLHCNYNNGLAEDKDQSLNLTEQQAKALLKRFDYIVIGHEHSHATYLNDRVIIVGCQHPTSFSDVSNKYWIGLDPWTGKISKYPTWRMEDGYAELDIQQLLDDKYQLMEWEGRSFRQVNFIRLIGRLPVERAGEIADAVRHLWAECPELIALRQDNIEFISAAGEQEVESVAIESLPEVMMEELDDEGIKELMAEALEACRQ